jgi:hypothetical protein
MSLLPDLNQSPFVLLGQIKTKIEKKLGKPVDSYSVGVDCEKNQLHFNVEGYPEEIQKDKMAVFVMKKGIRMTLGKKSPDFKRCTIFYKSDYIHITLVLADGSVNTKSITKND